MFLIYFDTAVTLCVGNNAGTVMLHDIDSVHNALVSADMTTATPTHNDT